LDDCQFELIKNKERNIYLSIFDIYYNNTNDLLFEYGILSQICVTEPETKTKQETRETELRTVYHDMSYYCENWFLTLWKIINYDRHKLNISTFR